MKKLSNFFIRTVRHNLRKILILRIRGFYVNF